MKITGYRVEHYLMKMDRADRRCQHAGWCGDVAGLDPLPRDRRERHRHLARIRRQHRGTVWRRSKAPTRAETVALWIRMNDWLHKAGNEGAASVL